MVDPIAIAEKIIEAAICIHDRVEEIKKFKDKAKELDHRTQLLQPSLQVLADMKSQRQELSVKQQDEPEISLFSQALADMFTCVNDIKLFIDDLNEIGTMRKFLEKATILDKFEDFTRRLDILERSIQFGVLVEMKQEIDSGKKKCTAQTLVDHLKRKSNVFGSAGVLPNNAVSVGETRMGDWRLVSAFQGYKGMSFKRANAVAVCPDNNLAVVDSSRDIKAAYLFNRDGSLIQRLRPSYVNTESEIVHPQNIAVTSQGNLVLVDRSKYVKVFNTSGKYLRSFCTLAENEDQDIEVRSESVALSEEGDIFVGDIKRGLITIHDKLEGRIIDKINVNMKPEYLAITKNQTILVSDFESCKVVAIDMTGNTLFVIDKWIADGVPGCPWGLTCDSEDNIYVVVRTMSVNSGHIHVYTDNGVYSGCIAHGLYYPKGIAWFDDSLYVANDKSVIQFSMKRDCLEI